MLNDMWNSFVNEVETTKKYYEDLEGNIVQANANLNDGIDTLLKCVNSLKKKQCIMESCYNDLCNKFDEQQHTIHDTKQNISYYSSWVMKEAMDHQLNVLEQCITGQDDQIKILLTNLAAAEEGCCCCGEDTLEVTFCCCPLG